MDLSEKFDEAVRKTRIIRSRYRKLNTFEPTVLPYVLIGRSVVSRGTTVIREGTVEVGRAVVHLPDGAPQLDGFDFASTTHLRDETLATFLLVRGVRLPSLKYRNSGQRLETSEQPVEREVARVLETLSRREDLDTGVIVGITDVWQFSLLIYVFSQVVRSAGGDVRAILSRVYDAPDS